MADFHCLWKKPTQHCKAIFLQLKKKKRWFQDYIGGVPLAETNEELLQGIAIRMNNPQMFSSWLKIQIIRKERDSE